MFGVCDCSIHYSNQMKLATEALQLVVVHSEPRCLDYLKTFVVAELLQEYLLIKSNIKRNQFSP